MTIKEDKDLHIRISATALESAQQQANVRTGGNVSAYIRLLIAEQSPGTDPSIKLRMDKIRREINMIGVNINQIAKKGNENFLTETEVERLFENQNLIFNLLNTFIAEIRKGGKKADK